MTLSGSLSLIICSIHMTKSQYISPTPNSWGQVWETLPGFFLRKTTATLNHKQHISHSNISQSSSPGWCRKFGREGRLQGLKRLSLGRSSFSLGGCHVLPGNPCGVGHLYWKPVISEVMGPLYSKWYYKWVTGVITLLKGVITHL